MYNLMKKFGKGQRGLTLLEMLGVIVIIAILAAVLITRINASMDKGRETGIKNDFRAFTLATETVLQESNGASDNGETVRAWMLNENLDAALQFGGDLSSAKQDPWKGQYSVAFAKATDPTATADGTAVNDAVIVVTSTGKDTTAGTADDYKLYTYLYKGQVSTCTVGYTGGKNQVSDIPLVGDTCGNAVVTP